MKTLLLSLATAAAFLTPATVSAQAIPGAAVAVVDLGKVTEDCNACKTARATLQSQATALQNRQKTLAGPLSTEGKSIQDAINALNGKEPDAALKARAQAWENKRQQAADEIQRQDDQVRANAQYVQKQIAEKLAPIYQSVMQRRGANVLLESGATLAIASSVDVTNDVLAALNSAMPSLQTTAPAAPKPQGR